MFQTVGAESYNLTVQEVSDRRPECSTTIACGETVTGALDLDGDTDTYQFSGNANDVMSVTIGGGHDQWVACWQLFDPDGVPVGDVGCTGGGPPRQREYVLGITGDYTLEVFQTVGTDTYHLTLQEVSDQVAQCSATIACGAPVTGTLDVDGDTDTYRFDGDANDVVTVTIGGGEEGWVACWQLFDPEGDAVGDVGCTGGGFPQQIEYELATTGSYTIKVFQTVGAGEYLLTLGSVPPCPMPTPTTDPERNQRNTHPHADARAYAHGHEDPHTHTDTDPDADTHSDH